MNLVAPTGLKHGASGRRVASSAPAELQPSARPCSAYIFLLCRVRSVCPQIYGLFAVKLACLLMLIGGVARADASGTTVRGEVHMLLVGDPGTGVTLFRSLAAKRSF